jgi:L-fuconolactonase
MDGEMIDSHHHFWWSARHAYRWPPAVGDRLARDFMPDDLRPELKHCGVDGTVLIQVLHDSDETQEFLDLCGKVEFVRGVVGWLPLSDPDATSRAIERLRKRGKLVGVRHLISREGDPHWLLQQPVIESLTVLAAAGIVFDAIPINAAQFEAVLEAGARLPQLKMVINHLGRPPIPEQGWEPWASQMARSAENKNVAVKLSIGIDILTRWRWSTQEIRRYSDHVLALFGPERVMAASNWPVILLAASYVQAWNGIVSLLSGLSEDARRAVLGETAQRSYRLSS